jgi:hypothetical protein
MIKTFKAKGGEKMKVAKILIPAVLVLMFSAAAMPVMAIGPQKAAEVGNNPHLTYFVGPGGGEVTFLETPPDTSFLWINRETQPDIVFLFFNAEKGQGKMNNAIVANGTNWVSIISSTGYWNDWIYLSGESGGETWNGHGMLYWILRALGFNHDSALEDAMKHTYGVFMQKISPGQ